MSKCPKCGGSWIKMLEEIVKLMVLRELLELVRKNVQEMSLHYGFKIKSCVEDAIHQVNCQIDETYGDAAEEVE